MSQSTSHTISKINLLSEDLINKIAAGEVIERPASVVKELIENSLDAQAKKITIEIEDSGKRLIKVSDNGLGMNKEDAEKSILRHATSKLKDEQDLFNITSLGFRGEALASIAAVSQLSIVTKQAEQPEGFNLVIEGGNIISSGIIASERGTTIEVRNLFFNTPARKKFLKTDQVELRHIIDIVLRYAMINQKISFTLLHDGHNLLNSPTVEDLRSNISAIYGTKLAKELLEINYQSEDKSIVISGFIAPPSQARNDKNQQFLYINGRWVRNNHLIQAVYDAFHSLLFVNRHPVLVLNLELDPKEIDVNIHPAKTEVKIEQRETVCNAVFNAVKEALQKNNLIPTVDVDIEQQVTFGTPRVMEEGRKEERTEPKYSFEPSRQSVFPQDVMPTSTDPQPPSTGLLGKNDEREIIQQAQRDTDTVFIEKSQKTETYLPEKETAIFTTESDKIPTMKLLGQIHKTFFAAETEDGLFLLDQHAVHERVLYEKFMTEYLNKEVSVQKLLKGEIIEFTPVEKAAVLDYRAKLQEFGFFLEDFGENAFVIKTIPSLLGRQQPKEMIYEILSKLDEGKSKPDEIQEEIITRMACRSAVMAGDELTISQMEGYLRELSETELPWTCPHGRPTMFKISVDELEKKFKRKG